MPFAFTLYDFWNLVLIASVYADLTYFSAVGQNHVSGMVQKAMVELARSGIISRLHSPLGLTGKRRNAKQHVKRERRYLTVPGQPKLSAALTDGNEIAKGRVYSAAQHGITQLANSVDS